MRQDPSIMGGIIIKVGINALMALYLRRLEELEKLIKKLNSIRWGEWVYMKMKPEEITAIIKQQIQDYDVDLNVDDVGTVFLT